MNNKNNEQNVSQNVEKCYISVEKVLIQWLRLKWKFSSFWRKKSYKNRKLINYWRGWTHFAFYPKITFKRLKGCERWTTISASYNYNALNTEDDVLSMNLSIKCSLAQDEECRILWTSGCIPLSRLPHTCSPFKISVMHQNIRLKRAQSIDIWKSRSFLYFYRLYRDCI